MAAWRRRAQALLPELFEEFARDEPLSSYLFFLALCPFVREAHAHEDTDALRRAYAFAQWCHHQRVGSDLPNAVGVSFYEHLFDDWSQRHAVIPWLSPHVRKAALPLWEARLAEDRVAELRELLTSRGDERWRELRGFADARTGGRELGRH